MVWKLYYDGGCNLCHASKLKVEKWAERAGQPLEVDILQGEAAIAKGYAGAEMVLEAEQVYTAADAWLRMMSIAPWYLRWLVALRYTPPTRWLARVGYNLVARFRYRWFGTRACAIPAKAPSRTEQTAVK